LQSGLLPEACKALISDDAFHIPSSVAHHAVQTTLSLMMTLIEQNHESASTFEKKLVSALQEGVVKARGSSGNIYSNQIWSAYHSFVLPIPKFAIGNV